MNGDEAVRLDCYDKEEWWDVCRRVRPDMTREQYDKDWDEFVKTKAERERQRGMN